MFNVQTAKNSGWQAAYLYKNGRQIAHLGIDPGNIGDYPPAIFGGIFFKNQDEKIQQHCFRQKIPYLKYKSGASELFYAAYQFQKRLLMKLDGRKY